MKRYQTKFKEDDGVELLKQIESTVDLTPLENEVKKIIGKDIKLSVSLRKDRYLHVESKDLTAFTGIFKKVYNTCKLETFNTSIVKDDAGELVWWMSIDFSFSYKSGGSNGTEILKSWYNINTKKWTFRSSI